MGLTSPSPNFFSSPWREPHADNTTEPRPLLVESFGVPGNAEDAQKRNKSTGDQLGSESLVALRLARALRRSKSSPSEMFRLSRQHNNNQFDADLIVAARAAALNTSADDYDLLEMARTPPVIDPEMKKLASLGGSVTEAKDMYKTEPKMPESQAKRKRHHPDVVACHRCGEDDTPRWRTGPDGPHTLCNVCGLVYARRERRRHAPIEKT